MIKIFSTRKTLGLKGRMPPNFHIDENLEDQALSKERLLEIVQNYDGLISSVSDDLNKDVFSFCKKLKAIFHIGAGINNIDLKAAKKYGIKVYQIGDVATISTADFCFALLLSYIRKIPEAVTYVKEGKWSSNSSNLFVGEELYGRTFGIYGFGNIGREVAKRAIAFGLKVLFYDHKEIVVENRTQQVTFDELLEKSDYLSLHVPLTDETRHSISYAEFEKINKNSILINLARGAVIETEALIDALKTKKIRAALLDVVDPEPISPDHPLLQMENCLIVPHIGGVTYESSENAEKKVEKALLEHFG